MASNTHLEGNTSVIYKVTTPHVNLVSRGEVIPMYRETRDFHRIPVEYSDSYHDCLPFCLNTSDSHYSSKDASKNINLDRDDKISIDPNYRRQDEKQKQFIQNKTDHFINAKQTDRSSRKFELTESNKCPFELGKVTRCVLPKYMSGSISYDKLSNCDTHSQVNTQNNSFDNSLLNFDHTITSSADADQPVIREGGEHPSKSYTKENINRQPGNPRVNQRHRHRSVENTNSSIIHLNDFGSREDVEYIGLYTNNRKEDIGPPPPSYIPRTISSATITSSPLPPPPVYKEPVSIPTNINPSIPLNKRASSTDIRHPPPAYHEAVETLKRNSRSLPRISHDSGLFSPPTRNGKHYPSTVHLPSYSDHIRGERNGEQIQQQSSIELQRQSIVSKKILNEENGNNNVTSTGNIQTFNTVKERLNNAVTARLSKGMRQHSADDVLNFLDEPQGNREVAKRGRRRLVKGRSLDTHVADYLDECQQPLTLKTFSTLQTLSTFNSVPSQHNGSKSALWNKDVDNTNQSGDCSYQSAMQKRQRYIVYNNADRNSYFNNTSI